MTNWQPIETYSPERDEAHVLLWNGTRVFVGWLSDDGDGWHDSTNPDEEDDAEKPQPTHWMPFPDPPTA
jgi:hypothetical protein